MVIMKMIKVCRCALAVALALFAATGNARLAQTYHVSLDPQDTTAVVQAACRRNEPPAAEEMNAWRYVDREDAPINVYVVCAARPTATESPVRSRAMCSNESKQWTCEDEGDFIEVTAAGRRAHVLLPHSGADVAIDIVRYLLTVDRLEDVAVSTNIDGSTCEVSPDASDTWKVRCNLLVIEVQRIGAEGAFTYRATRILAMYAV